MSGRAKPPYQPWKLEHQPCSSDSPPPVSDDVDKVISMDMQKANDEDKEVAEMKLEHTKMSHDGPAPEQLNRNRTGQKNVALEADNRGLKRRACELEEHLVHEQRMRGTLERERNCLMERVGLLEERLGNLRDRQSH